MLRFSLLCNLSISQFAFCFLVFISCNEKNAGADPIPETANEMVSDDLISDTLSYLALGDSYTIGESVEEFDRFPVQLVTQMRLGDYLVSDAKIIARTGWTTDELQSAIDQAGIQGTTYSIVSLLIGVNNQFRGYPIKDYEAEFLSLLKQAIVFAGGDQSRVFVLSIPDYGVTPFGKQRGEEEIAQEIDEFNAVNQAISTNLAVNYIDITDISRVAKTDSTLIADDLLHPSGKMYSQWVERLYAKVDEVLNK